MDDPALAPYRHYLGVAALERRHALDPLAEEAFAARGDAASSAWRRLYDDTMTAVSVPFDAGDGVEPHTLEALSALLFHPDRDVRLRAVAAAREARGAIADTAAACLDAVIGDRLVEDRLRGHDDPMGATLFTDQVSRADVEALLTAIEGRACDRAPLVRAQGRGARHRRGDARPTATARSARRARSPGARP